METVIAAIILLLFVLATIRILSESKGPGLFAGFIGGAIGGGILHKILSRNPENSPESEQNNIDIESTENRIRKAVNSIESLRQNVSEADRRSPFDTEPSQSSGQRRSDGSPEASELYKAVKSMEEPLNAFKLMAESSDKDLQKIIDDSKKFIQLKEQEKNHLDNIKEALDPGKGVHYMLEQLRPWGQEDIVEDQQEATAEAIIEKIREMDSTLEQIERTQSEYKNLLDQDEAQLLKDMYRNKTALKDIQKCIDAISWAEQAEKGISGITSKAQRHHSELQHTEEEIIKIESTIKQILNMEKGIIRQLDEITQMERQAEMVTEMEVEEVAEILEGTDSIQNMVKETSEFTEEQKEEILNSIKRLKKVLKKLGADLEKEEQEEEQIRQEASEAEERALEQVKQDNEKLSEFNED